MPADRSPSAPGSEADVWLTVPNGLSVLRLLAVIPFVSLVTQGKDWAAFALFVAAGLTDTLDGTLARRLGQTSKVGRLLDPLVDKLFTGAAYLSLSAFRSGLSHIPFAVMAAVLLRDLLILAGSLLVYRRSRNPKFKPSVSGKLNTFIEICTVGFFLGSTGLPAVAVILPVLYGLLFVSLAISTAGYWRAGLRMMRE